ncbi:cryptochrome/photolyase family protein [Granulosicoccus sp. 3-233]|uniref:cryptochrome/photolyase family protein n=1 Tax=Granulosicoccus sp. 3-233 TaxID=3417969 RepID=UPI003D34C28A
MSRGLMWFRQDLRLSDNPALSEACRSCDELLCVFIDDPMEQGISRLGAASRVWLHHSLAALDRSLRDEGSELFLARGDASRILRDYIEKGGIDRVFWNRCYDPATIARDKHIKSALSDCEPRTFNGLLIHEPWQNLKSDGSPYRVYTPYWRAAARLVDEDETCVDTLQKPRVIPGLSPDVANALSQKLRLDELQLLPSLDWHESMMSHWTAGEDAARAQLERFLKGPVNDYGVNRDRPGVAGTSRLSPHLHFGEISPRHVMNRLLAGRKTGALSDDENTFAREIVWREFAYAILFHFPQTIDEPLDERFSRFAWRQDIDRELERWQRGMTGVPIVDAGMRELYATGWMHNRVRMIVASFLIKNLLIPWQAGERWFRDTLVDADLASNSMGWQWTAGSGVDASPFFRVFNPVLQGEKFDKQGDYVRHWVPELAEVETRYLHKPWELDEATRKTLDYPEPLVDLKQTRQEALDAFAQIKGTN